MDVVLAAQEDLPDLALLLWLHASPEQRTEQRVEDFAVALGAWWSGHEVSHRAFVARSADGEAVGTAWLALVPRVPRPGATSRVSADIQSVFVVPGRRGRGIGAALVGAATRHALAAGAATVTVQSSRRAVPLYERLGFAPSPQLLQTSVEQDSQDA